MQLVLSLQMAETHPSTTNCGVPPSHNADPNTSEMAYLEIFDPVPEHFEVCPIVL
jgi:hypothetical protein